MVSSKKVHCAYCHKKCTGNTLRYQDQYYHKHCFQLAQQQQSDERQVAPAVTADRPQVYVDSATSGSGGEPADFRAGTPVQVNTSQETPASNQPQAMPTVGDARSQPQPERLSSQQLNRAPGGGASSARSATLPQSRSWASNGFSAPPSAATNNSSRTLDNRVRPPLDAANSSNGWPGTPVASATCAACRERILDGQALIALERHWHVWCFKCSQCKAALHGEYVAKDGRAYCERDYQKLFGITCVYCKRYITGKVLQAGEAHHFHPSCARCSKCGDPFVPGEEMYLQGEVTWHPRCGPGPNGAPAQPESSLMEADDRSQLRSSRALSPSLSSRSHSRSASPFSYMSRQYGRASPAYAESEALGDLSRVYTISYLNDDPNQGYLRRPVEPRAPKSPQFSRPTSLSRLAGGERSRCSSRSQQYASTASGLGGQAERRERSVPRGMYSVLSGMGRSGRSSRARSPSMMNEEAIQLAAYPSGQRPSPDAVPKIERDDFPAPPFPHAAGPHQRAHPASNEAGGQQQHRRHHQHQNHERDGHLVKRHAAPAGTTAPNGAGQERASRPRSRELAGVELLLRLERRHSVSSAGSSIDSDSDPQFRKEEEELSKIANGIGKIFLQTLKEREKLRAWKRANLDPRNASRTPSATRELPNRLRYENPTNASPSRDMDRPRPWERDEATESELAGSPSTLGLAGVGAGEHSPTRARSPAPAANSSSALSSTYGYKVLQASRSTPRPGYGLAGPPSGAEHPVSFAEQQRVAQARANDLLGRQAPGAGSAVGPGAPSSALHSEFGATKLPNFTSSGSTRSLASAAHFRRSMPNVAQLHHLHQEGAPKLYPYHLLATSNYRLPPGVDRCHLERHLSNEEFHYIFHCDRLDFYRLPEWKRNELKRRARLF